MQHEQQCKLRAGAGGRERGTRHVPFSRSCEFYDAGVPSLHDGRHQATSARQRSMLHAAETLRCGVLLHHVQFLLKLSTVMPSATAVPIFLYKMRAQR